MPIRYINLSFRPIRYFYYCSPCNMCGTRIRLTRVRCATRVCACIYKSAIGSGRRVQLWMQGKGAKVRGCTWQDCLCILTARRHDVSAFSDARLKPTSEKIYRGDTWARDGNCFQLDRGYLLSSLPVIYHVILLPRWRLCPYAPSPSPSLSRKIFQYVSYLDVL